MTDTLTRSSPLVQVSVAEVPVISQHQLDEIYPKILVQRSASQSGHLEETYPKILVQRSGSQASQVPLEEIYPHLRMQRSSSGGRLDEIYPKILVQRSGSQMSQPRSVSQLSQMAGEETSVYPQLMRQRSGSAFSQLGEDMSVYPRVIASNGALVTVPVTSSPSLAQLDEIYPKLLKQQLTSSVQLSQLPGAQLSASLTGYEEEHLPVYENVYENIVVNNQAVYNNQLDYVNLPPPPPYPGTTTDSQVLPNQSYIVTAAGQHVLTGSQHVTSGGQHLIAGSQHVTANGQHLIAGSQHVTANGQHVLAGSQHVTTNGHHLIAGSQHVKANGQHVLAGNQRVTTAGQHILAGSQHVLPRGQNLTSVGQQNITGGQQVLAGGHHVISGSHHVRNLSDTSGQSESSSGSILSYKSSGGGGGGGAGWYETEMDSSSETLTPHRNLHQSPQLRPALLTNLPPKPGSASLATSGQKALLPFSITPPRPPGPSKAEMKVRLLSSTELCLEIFYLSGGGSHQAAGGGDGEEGAAVGVLRCVSSLQ